MIRPVIIGFGPDVVVGDNEMGRRDIDQGGELRHWLAV